jgi:GTP cyclohydrolase IA
MNQLLHQVGDEPFESAPQRDDINQAIVAVAAVGGGGGVTMDAEEELSTVVTHSSAGGNLSTMTEEDDEDDDQKLGLSKSNSAKCPNRATGHVCICASCEAARTRLLHRANKTSSTSATMTSLTASGTEGAVSNKRHRPDDNEGTLVAPSSSSLVSTVARLPSKSDGNGNDNDDDIDEQAQVLAKMSAACKTILQCIGEDPDREGLVKTPERWAKALLFMCHGYHMSPSDVTNGAVFAENHDEMVVVRNIDIHSLCEHHMVPFTGHVHIGYIPNGKILGLSKLARIAELYARRLQVQERLTRQIADAILETIQPLGVAVVIECTHFCMVMRGVQKCGAVTTTSSVRGCFETNPKTRAEFFSILHGGGRAK